MWPTQFGPMSHGCRSSVLFQMVKMWPPPAFTASTTGRQLGESLGSQAIAQLPLVLETSALISASDFSLDPSLMRCTRALFGLPMLSTNASPPEAMEFQ